MILAGALRKRNLLLEMPLQFQFFAKPVNQDDSAEVGKVLVSDGNLYFSEASGHRTQGSFLRKVLSDNIYRYNCTQIPSVLQVILPFLNTFFTHY